MTDNIFEAARTGNVDALERLLNNGANIEQRDTDPDTKGYTPLMVAAVANQEAAVLFLLRKDAKADVRDDESCTLIKRTVDAGYDRLAERIIQERPNLEVTDPRLQKGKEWLTAEFGKVVDNIQDVYSRPKPTLLDKFVAVKRDEQGRLVLSLGPETPRDVSDVYWEHIFLRYIGDIPLDIERNYSKALVLSLVGTFEEILKGHEGIKRSAWLLNQELKTTKYDIVGTVVQTAGNWVTERWGYRNPDNEDPVRNRQVVDGIDSFLIYDGKIAVKMINYTITETVDTPEVYKQKVGLPASSPPFV